MPQPFKTLVLCFDGTWNTIESHTNVSGLHAEIADETSGCPAQRKFYDEGVGTKWYDRVRGGVLGYGLDANIRAGYAWLASVYECEEDAPDLKPPATETRKPNGDRVDMPPHSSGQEFLAGSDICITGFSRGAFTARSLGGLINYLGIPRIDPGRVPDGKPLADHPDIQKAWDLYDSRPMPEERQSVRDGKASAALLAKIKQHDGDVAAFRGSERTRWPVRIHFMGVWDTVGALGIPPVFGLFPNPLNAKYRFHDTSLGESVRHAYHAVAIDEHRLPFRATLWTARQPTTEAVEQRWFPGAHADVGGGYPDDLLHELPLLWLATKAAAVGIEFVNDRKLQLPVIPPSTPPRTFIPPSIAMPPSAFDLDQTEYLSPVHDSYAEFVGGLYQGVRAVALQGPVYRRMLVPADGIEQTVDPAAFQKWKMDSTYRPPNLAQAGRTDVSYAVARDLDEAAGTA